MLVTVLFIVTMMLTGRLSNGLPKHRFSRACASSCPAGSYLSNCRCYQCGSGFYTSEENREDACHRCFQGCKSALNMEVVKNCTSTSDVECRCRDGFSCTKRDSYSHHCDRCDPITTPTPSLPFTSAVSQVYITSFILIQSIIITELGIYA